MIRLPSGVSIEAATIRDASYIMANLRPLDLREVRCQIPDSVTMVEMSYAMLHSGDSFIASYRGKPVVFFGTSAMNVACAMVWAVGTKNAPRVIPAVTRFMIHEHIPNLIDRGFLTLEARSYFEHVEAHRWMLSAGAHKSGAPFYYGKDRELFQLFRWTIEEFEAIRTGRWSARHADTET